MSTQIFTLTLQTANGTPYTANILSAQAAGARDKEIWAIVPAAALSWHLVTLPAGLRKQAQRVLPVLQSLLEETLLEEPALMHLALQPEWEDGKANWVASCNKAWLQGHLLQLQSTGHRVHRIVPEWTPPALSQSENLTAWINGTPEDAWLWVSDAQGAWRLPLQAGLKFWGERLNAETRPESVSRTLQIQAAPSVANLAQQSLASLQTQASTALKERLSPWRVVVSPALERYAMAANSQWDLAQFEFAAHGRARSLQSLQRAWRLLSQDAAWRPARWALGLLLAAQLVGLNVAAWQLAAQVKTQRDVQKNILLQSFPQTFANVPIIDASLQMRKAVDQLQRNAGALSSRDLESVLQAVGSALPAGQNLSHVDYQMQANGETRLQGLQLTSAQAQSFKQALSAQGLDAQLSSATWRIVSTKEGL